MRFIDYQVSDHIATLTINRPEALNALNREVLTELRQVLQTVAAQLPRVLVVTGAGRAFVAGADIASMANYTQAEAADFSALGSGVFRALETLPMPTIAAVNGFALGGGCELALACDLRLASTKAVFAQPEVGLGIPAGFGGTQRLPRLIGEAQAKQLLFTGAKIDAHRALELGLVNAVHEPDQLLAAANELAATIASQAPIAVRATKGVIAAGASLDIDAALTAETAAFAACFETADQVEAMTAFAQKRRPAPFQDQ